MPERTRAVTLSAQWSVNLYVPLDEALDDFTRDGAPRDEEALRLWLKDHADHVMDIWDVALDRTLDFAHFDIEDVEVPDGA